MTTLKELHQKMIENGFKINLKEEFPIDMVTILTVEQILEKYGDCPATKDYPAAISVQVGKKAWQTALIVYSK
jgi:hypothetical protein